MGRHPGGTAAARTVRPRYGRITAALSAVVVTTVALLGAGGVLPATGGKAPAWAADAATVTSSAGAITLRSFPGPLRMRHPRDRFADGAPGVVEQGGQPPTAPPAASSAADEALPVRSGTGRRVVFDMSAQRVWLVAAGDRVRRSYLVSGSLTNNLRPGSYEVYSTSRHAVGIDDSGTMGYMVRFAHGKRAAIGFHDIPVKDGEPVQTRGELGTPQSHGCVRQWRPDARALWEFAPVGTPVVVIG
jgi:lipoprotein-anchoring transpeptidase ErfK/SrfK